MFAKINLLSLPKYTAITFFLALIACTTTTAALAQTDTIRIPDKKLNIEHLKPGMNQYLIIMQNTKNQKKLFLWYWFRNIKMENYNGVQVFAIEQHWYASDTANYRSIYSINRRSDFAPIYHSETIKGETNAYDWNDKQITQIDSTDDSTKKRYTLDFTSPNLNWNLDIETFEMMPLDAGRTFAINFYDAGLDSPKYIIYKVIGSEEINYGGSKTDCWKLYTEGSSKNGNYKETYWISKKEHQFLKEEDEYGNGLFRSKIKMPIDIKLAQQFSQ